MDYIECLFVGPGNKPKESPLKNNLIHSVDSALTHVGRLMQRGTLCSAGRPWAFA